MNPITVTVVNPRKEIGRAGDHTSDLLFSCTPPTAPPELDSSTKMSIPCFYFVPVSRKIKDNFIQNWFTDIENLSKLHCYRSFKTCFEFENYLNCVINDKQRIELTRLRCSSHQLLIEERRFSSIPRENRICKLCNLNEIEDEFHFVLICPLYHQIRS